MHRKNTRRWHKLLSVSSILFFFSAALFIPTATAAPTPPDVTGLYSSDYSKAVTPTFYIDFNLNVNDLKSEDFYVTGTSTGCLIGSIPSVYAFSFGFQVSNCSDGTVVLNLKANSVYTSEGAWGPAQDYVGTPMQLDRTPLELTFDALPPKITAPEMQWKVFSTHVARTVDYSKVELVGCSLDWIQEDTDGVTLMTSNCQQGSTAQLKLLPGFITDRFQNTAPAEILVTATIPILLDGVPVVTPTPSPTSSPTAAPTASPTATPEPTPSPTATVTDPTASVVAVIPPTDPPAPPTVQEPITQPEPVGPEPVLQPEPEFVLQSPTLDTPITNTANRIKPVKVQTQPLMAIPAEPAIEAKPAEQPPLEIVPVAEVVPEPKFNWQPIGYLAIAVGASAGAVGGGLLLKKYVRVRRLKFS
jgi:hypothetical protein